MLIFALFFYLGSIAVVAAVIALIMRLIVPGFPFWAGFLIAYAGTFFTLFATAVLIGIYHHHR